MMNTFQFARNAKANSIQYLGLVGISQSCLNAVKRLIQFGDHIENVTILTSDDRHALILTVVAEGLIAIKSGFSSGYPGEGPKALAQALSLLRAYGVGIEERIVPIGLIKRLNAAALTEKDLDLIEKTPECRPMRWTDYIHNVELAGIKDNQIWRSFDPVMPWSIIDDRIADLALRFLLQPDEVIFLSFRRLEDIVRSRLKTDLSSSKLFSYAFIGDDSPLVLSGVDSSEIKGRGQLFTAAYMAYRNPRAHREIIASENELLTEFLMINHLFRLEKEATERSPAKNANKEEFQ